MLAAIQAEKLTTYADCWLKSGLLTANSYIHNQPYRIIVLTPFSIRPPFSFLFHSFSFLLSCMPASLA